MADADDDPFSLDFTSFVPPPRPPEPAPAAPSGLSLVPREGESMAKPELALVDVDAPLPGLPATPEPVAAAPAAPPSRYPMVKLPPALLAAADMYAKGMDMEACRRLESAIKANEPLGETPTRVWQALFESLQALGRQEVFEKLALAYATGFGLSPPTWMAPIEEDDQVVSTEGGGARVAFSGTLNARVGDALKQMMEVARKSAVVRLDLSKLTDADNDGATLLMRALTALKKAGKECLLGSPEQLAAILSTKVEVCRVDSEPIWLLMLELYQQAGNQEGFEEAAVNYAVTFEVSPPSFVSLASKPAIAEAAPVEAQPKPTLALNGQLIGATEAEFAEIANCTQDEVEIHALGLVRIDQASVNALRAVLQRLNEAGRYVRIIGLSQLVAAFLTARNVGDLAELRLRKV